MILKIKYILLAAFILNCYMATCCVDHNSTDSMNHSNSNEHSTSFEENSAELSNKTKELNIASIMTHCNESFRTTMDYLTELNTTGSFPDETDKTPMVNNARFIN